MISRTQINEVAKTILEKFKARRVFLFGSYANGRANLESDLDLCVIADLNGKRKIEVLREIRREVSQTLNNPMDILLYEENEFTERAMLKNTLENDILKNGIVING